MDASKPSILVVDDEMGPRESLKMILNPYYNVHTADRGTQAVEMLKQIPVDLVTVDLKMPGFSGINVLEKVKQHDPDIEAIIITGYGSLDTAIEGLRLGAFDYIRNLSMSITYFPWFGAAWSDARPRLGSDRSNRIFCPIFHTN